MKHARWISASFAAVLAGIAVHALASRAAPPPPPPPRIELVLALDVSGSMDGLIGSAKARLWDIVNELAKAQPAPEIRVALYTYGADGYDPSRGYVRQEIGFTRDLEQVYARLTSLTTSGGNEYVARVVKAAAEELDWAPGDRTLRLLFVAGNEKVDQDPTHALDAVSALARDKGIFVSTIYCGTNGPEGYDWSTFAASAAGAHAVIDQALGMRVASTPVDARLAQLSRELTRTYLAYGKRGHAAAQLQGTNTMASYQLGESVAASRAIAMNNGLLYDASEWDLVDAMRRDPGALERIPAADLPAEMRGLSRAALVDHVRALSEKRAAIQREITALAGERDRHLGTPTVASFDGALRESIHELAARKGFTFPQV